MTSAIHAHREVWESKPVLRLIYTDLHQRIAQRCRPGPTLEIGSGIGNLRSVLPDTISLDIQFDHSIDVVSDAQLLPFAAGTFDNIVMFDVLHHLEYPVRFLREAMRVLKPGGRIVAMEPAITIGSTLFYRLLHHEPVRMSVDPLTDGRPDPNKDPYDSNQAIPTLLVTRFKERLQAAVPELTVLPPSWMSLAAYPLSGGFKKWSLITESMARLLLRFERPVERIAGRLLAFRVLIVLERSQHNVSNPGE